RISSPVDGLHIFLYEIEKCLQIAAGVAVNEKLVISISALLQRLSHRQSSRPEISSRLLQVFKPAEPFREIYIFPALGYTVKPALSCFPDDLPAPLLGDPVIKQELIPIQKICPAAAQISVKLQPPYLRRNAAHRTPCIDKKEMSLRLRRLQRLNGILRDLFCDLA